MPRTMNSQAVSQMVLLQLMTDEAPMIVMVTARTLLEQLRALPMALQN